MDRAKGAKLCASDRILRQALFKLWQFIPDRHAQAFHDFSLAEILGLALRQLFAFSRTALSRGVSCFFALSQIFGPTPFALFQILGQTLSHFSNFPDEKS